MAKQVQLRTTEDLLIFLERVATAIVAAGEMTSRSGTLVNLVSCAHKIIEGSEVAELRKQIEQIERVVGGSNYVNFSFIASEKNGETTGTADTTRDI